jgi:hypothetical protein
VDFLTGVAQGPLSQEDVNNETNNKQEGKCKMDKHCQFRTLLNHIRIVMVFKYYACGFRENKNVRDKGNKEKP